MRHKFFLWLSCTCIALCCTGALKAQTEISTKTPAILWTQKAAEYRALCYQAFNIATMRIDQIPKRSIRKEQLCIITDLDETILNNSPVEAQLIKEDREFSGKSWMQWLSMSAATAVPGATEFLRHVHQKGISIFYISNRGNASLQNTLVNLQNLHLPDADTSHILLLTDSSSKETRRNKVSAQYKIVMLLGDNLNDFAQAFEQKSIADRFTETDKARDEWGKRFIVLPNCIYGEWENALYEYRRGLTPQQKAEIRKSLLMGYQN